MIEILFFRNDILRSRVEEDDPETAVFAARTLWEDDWRELPIQGSDRKRRVDFIVDGVCVRTVTGRKP